MPELIDFETEVKNAVDAFENDDDAAGRKAVLNLGVSVLRDIRRIADALERLAPTASPKSPMMLEEYTVGGFDIKAAVLLVKTVCGTEVAKEIIERLAGQGKKLSDLASMPEQTPAVLAACQEALDAKHKETTDAS